MSGPVWRRLKEPEQVCEICLENNDIANVEGIVESGEFLPRRRLCDKCYKDMTEAAN